MSPRGRPSRKQRERARQRAVAALPQAQPEAVAGAWGRRFVVEAAEAGLRLDRLLSARLPELSRGRVQELISRGLVLGGGAPLPSSARPVAGVQLEVLLAGARPSALAPVQLDLAVIYEDAALLVLDKPAGIAVHPGAGTRGPTILHGLLHHLLGTGLRPGLVHRLDKDTSGCLAVAKTEPALRALQQAFQGRTVDKRYRALVHGAPPDSGELDTLYGPHPSEPRRFSSRVAEGARARTRYRVLGRGPSAALLEVELLTGRRHQIRAHLADAGFPLLGDERYGGTALEAALPAEAPARLAAEALGRQGLHAFQLGFAHPIAGVKVECTAALPTDFCAALALLGIASG